MSEKPVASIKTLARYEPDTVYIGTGEYVAECVRADDGDYYLAADVDAEIEALRAEVDALREALAALKAENERLREALKDADNELDWLDEDMDTCDHSVGVCTCDYWNMRRKMKAALSKENSND
ncbi:hypothetical protein [Methylocaldum szegediense]|uniref:hypothetical protein n=1 Tax=Methylocaldum szegediense TaxID=73780 RepID=UPI0012EC7AD9|nr:hypothetical protein [Methylocaldum szegediense]